MNVPKLITVVGARPQIIKAAPFSKALKGNFQEVMVHSGQHYDQEMSQVLFDELELPKPSYLLSCGNQSSLKQIGQMILEFESIFLKENPQGIVVFGDTNTTLAGAIVAKKCNLPLIHIEAGLRSFNQTMPEEQNRILTDHLADVLFAPTPLAVENLQQENVTGKIFLVQDIMSDSLRIAREKIAKEPDLSTREFILVTLHRPVNTDNKERLSSILTALQDLNRTILFPLHPRTKQRMKEFGLTEARFPQIEFLPPQSFLKMIQLQLKATHIITDSGGIQKEAYLNRVPCITLRRETEWKETLQHGWNRLLFDKLTSLKTYLDQPPQDYIPTLYGDGFIAEKIVAHLNIYFKSKRLIEPKAKLFLLIPVYNEAKNIPRLLADLEQLSLRNYQLEVILCDDGSQDETRDIAYQEAKNLSLTILGDGKNKGPGDAFANGFEYLAHHIQREDLVVTMEGDNTSRIETLLKMIARLERENLDCVLASPYAYGGGITQTNFMRIFLSMTANTLVRFILKIPGIFTMSSFFRLYRGDLILQLQKKFGSRIVEQKGFICMIELLKKMTQIQATISEYPMLLDTSRRVGKSKMRITKTSIEYLRYLLFAKKITSLPKEGDSF